MSEIFILVDFNENKNEDFTVNMIRELILEWTCKVEIRNNYTALVEAQFEAWLNKSSENKYVYNEKLFILIEKKIISLIVDRFYCFNLGSLNALSLNR